MHTTELRLCSERGQDKKKIDRCFYPRCEWHVALSKTSHCSWEELSLTCKVGFPSSAFRPLFVIHTNLSQQTSACQIMQSSLPVWVAVRMCRKVALVLRCVRRFTTRANRTATDTIWDVKTSNLKHLAMLLPKKKETLMQFKVEKKRFNIHCTFLTCIFASLGEQIQCPGERLHYKTK